MSPRDPAAEVEPTWRESAVGREPYRPKKFSIHENSESLDQPLINSPARSRSARPHPSWKITGRRGQLRSPRGARLTVFVVQVGFRTLGREQSVWYTSRSDGRWASSSSSGRARNGP